MEGIIFLTGAAGYIGSHVAKKLLATGFDVIGFDNLSNGFIEPIQILQKKYQNFEFIKGDLSDRELLENILKQKSIDAVVHLAAKIDVNESMTNPDLYHQENYINSINLIDAMTKAGVNKLIFSSTAAVYGNPKYTPIDEKHPTNPTSPYGQTKLDFEKYLAKFENLKYVIFRYFNVGGSDPAGDLGKSHIKGMDLLENIMKVALGKQQYLEIFGNDYKTVDGTPVRDLLHVDDIAQAHLLTLEKIDKISSQIFNLGSETGFTVKEIIDRASLTTGKKLETKIGPRRQGDIEISVASAAKVKSILGWKPFLSNLNDILSTDWAWRKNHPMGYTN